MEPQKELIVAVGKVLSPPTFGFAFVTLSEANDIMRLCIGAVTIVCTILVTHSQIQKNKK